MWIILFVAVLWYSGLFFQSFFLHRYAAHQTYRMSAFGEKLCFVLTWLTQGSNYLSPYAYGVMHRMHHAYADTEQDPHSPKYDPSFFSMMWRTKGIFSDILNRRVKVEERFEKNVPQWRSFDLFASHWITRLAWAALYAVIFYWLATDWWQWLLLPVAWAMAPLHGVIINWFAHKYGYVNYKVDDTSKNLLHFDWLMMGEAYHNNHHKSGSRPNFGGVRWHEIDITYQVMRLLNFFGWIRLKPVSVPARELLRP